MTRALAAALLSLTLASASQAGAQPPIPRHPSELTYAPLSFATPDPAASRHVLANHVVAYMVEDHTLPLVTVTVLVKAGGFLDPPDKRGLASATGMLMRTGGTATLPPATFDDEVAFLAASLTSGFGPTSGQVSMNFLAKDTGRALDLLFQVLRTPRFDDARFDLYRTQVLQQMARRNDETESIEDREWTRLLRGPDHFTSQQPTKASLDRITHDDLVAFHRAHVHPGAFTFAISGDFQTADLVAKLDAAMAGWPIPTTGPAAVPTFAHLAVPGVYLVDKPAVNQGRVSIGHVGLRRGHPDEIAVDVMNDILGGAGFTSRIMARVRSDEGLAYSAGSGFVPGIHYPGWFRAGFQSKSSSVARAARIVLDEIDRIRREPVSAEELDLVKTSAIEIFPRYFASAGAVAGTFANDEATGRDPRYWQTYRDKVRAVTVEDVLRVAREHLRPERLVILIVGDAAAIQKGDADHPAFTLESLGGGRPPVRILLPNPLTLDYPIGPPPVDDDGLDLAHARAAHTVATRGTRP